MNEIEVTHVWFYTENADNNKPVIDKEGVYIYSFRDTSHPFSSRIFEECGNGRDLIATEGGAIEDESGNKVIRLRRVKS